MNRFNKVISFNLNDVKNMQSKPFNLNDIKNMHDAVSLNHHTCSFIKSYLKNRTYTLKFINNIDIRFTNKNFDYDLKKLFNSNKVANGCYFNFYTKNENLICVGFEIPEIGNSNFTKYLCKIIDNIEDTIYFVSINFDIDE